MMAVAEGVLLKHDKTRLPKYGGHVTITDSWAKSFLHRLGYAKRKGTKDAKRLPADFDTLQKAFAERVESSAREHDIPDKLVINWNQAGVSMVPGGEWTMEKCGTRQVTVNGLDDKQQITALLAVSKAGDFLPPQLIYGGRSDRCHPNFTFPEGWDVTHIESLDLLKLDFSGNNPVRLVNGEQTNTTITGRLEVFFAGMWGTVCTVGFEASTAKTVCGFLGYSGGYGIFSNVYGKGTGPIWLKDFKCLGNETDVAECSHKPWGNVDYCTHDYDIGLVCSNVPLASETYKLRLTGGETTEHAITGRLEVVFSGTWGTVCSYSTNAANAEPLCDFLGYNRGYGVSERSNGKHKGPVWLGRVMCTGNETDISQCSANQWGRTICSYSNEYVSLKCSNVSEVSGNNPVRLVNGEQTNTTITGRLEVFFAGMWGTVCEVGFEASTAKTVCGFLGYSRGYGIFSGVYGSGTGPIWLKDFKCLGNETDVAECSHKPWGNVDQCIHDYDIGLVCSNVPLASETYKLRLTGGETTDNAVTGLLEVFFSGTWGAVCSYSTDVATAGTLCGFLGYSRGSGVAETRVRKYKGPVWLGRLKCTGNETDISQCSADPWGRRSICAYRQQYVSLACSNASEGKIPIRLVNGEQTNTTITGRLEVFFADMWGTVCAVGFDASTAKTVCGFLGYSRGYGVFTGEYGSGTGPIWLNILKCLGNETNIAQCSHKPWGNAKFCEHVIDVALVCTNVPLASETYKMRLTGGETTEHAVTGRLEVFFSGTWGTVCSYSTDAATSRTLCGFLGYSRGYNVAEKRERKHIGPVWLGRLKCAGNETDITQCSADPWGSPFCSTREQYVYLTCSNVSEGTAVGDPGQTR